ncbi:leucine-rich repeat flightless-interacting protein 1-like isoform X2 [Protopterus annectens]|uniref:leucine-rich repeat flightless-interacting protein 1-like isoform X2 n=1 Tax=Protopterus annectens TaxID=7888 RepID=UPI001CFA1FE7|nr:leucine-rich repeat flightless-interacting protein 1-like isoform X2 [Protopterus annectens]
MGTPVVPLVRTQQEVSEDEALALMFKQADAELSAKRAARAKARQAHLNKVERHHTEEEEDLSEKYENVMESLLMVEKEKAVLLYEVEKLKDYLEETEEQLAEVMRKYEDKCKELESERLTNCRLEGKMKLLQKQLMEAEENMKEKAVIEMIHRATWTEIPEEQSLAAVKQSTRKYVCEADALFPNGLSEQQTDTEKLRDKQSPEVSQELKTTSQNKDDSLPREWEKPNTDAVESTAIPIANVLHKEHLEFEDQGRGVQDHKTCVQGSITGKAQHTQGEAATKEDGNENAKGLGENVAATSASYITKKGQKQPKINLLTENKEEDCRMENIRQTENVIDAKVNPDRNTWDETPCQATPEKQAIESSYLQHDNSLDENIQQEEDVGNEEKNITSEEQEAYEADMSEVLESQEGITKECGEQNAINKTETEVEIGKQSEHGGKSIEKMELFSADSAKTLQKKGVYETFIGNWLTWGKVKTSPGMNSTLVHEETTHDNRVGSEREEIENTSVCSEGEEIKNTVVGNEREETALQSHSQKSLTREDQTSFTEKDKMNETGNNLEESRVLIITDGIISTTVDVNTDGSLYQGNHGKDTTGITTKLISQDLDQNSCKETEESFVQDVLSGESSYGNDSSEAKTNDSHATRDGGTLNMIEKLIKKVSMRRRSQEYGESKQQEKESLEVIDGRSNESSLGILRFDPRATIEEMFVKASLEAEAAKEENSDDDVMHDCLENIEGVKTHANQILVDDTSHGDGKAYLRLEHSDNHQPTYPPGNMAFSCKTSEQEDVSADIDENSLENTMSQNKISVESDTSLQRNPSMTSIMGSRETLKRRKSSKRFTNSGDTCRIA